MIERMLLLRLASLFPFVFTPLVWFPFGFAGPLQRSVYISAWLVSVGGTRLHASFYVVPCRSASCSCSLALAFARVVSFPFILYLSESSIIISYIRYKKCYKRVRTYTPFSLVSLSPSLFFSPLLLRSLLTARSPSTRFVLPAPCRRCRRVAEPRTRRGPSQLRARVSVSFLRSRFRFPFSPFLVSYFSFLVPRFRCVQSQALGSGRRADASRIGSRMDWDSEDAGWRSRLGYDGEVLRSFLVSSLPIPASRSVCSRVVGSCDRLRVLMSRLGRALSQKGISRRAFI